MKSNNFNPAIPAALIPFVAPMASFAEGTSLVSSGEGTLRRGTVANNKDAWMDDQMKTQTMSKMVEDVTIELHSTEFDRKGLAPRSTGMYYTHF